MKTRNKKGTMIRTQIQLTRRQAEGLKRISSEQGGSMAELIRRAVDGLLKGSGLIDREELKTRALAAVGIAASGVGDIADNHDRYLDDAIDPRNT